MKRGEIFYPGLAEKIKILNNGPIGKKSFRYDFCHSREACPRESGERESIPQKAGLLSQE